MKTPSETEISFGKAPFTIKSEENYVLIALSGDLDRNVAKEFEKKSPGLAQENKDLLFDFTECTGIHPAWDRLFLTLATELKKNGKGMRFVSVSADIQRNFAEHGMGHSIKYCPSVENALRDLESNGAAPSKKMDVKVVNAFLDAVIQVMKTQTHTEVKAGAPFLKGPKDGFSGDLSGVIALVSDTFRGTMVINFPESTFLGMISRMLGEKFQVLTPEITDGAAELTNMVFGQAKVTLNELGYGMKMATPSVVTGKNPTTSSASPGPRVTVPFSSDLGDFAVEISIG